MKDNIKKFLEDAYAGADDTQKNRDLKDEIYADLCDKYDDFIKSGLSEAEAYRRTVNGTGDISSLFDRKNQNSYGPRNAGAFYAGNPGTSGSGNARFGTGGYTHENPTTAKVPLYSESETKLKNTLYPILHALAVLFYIISVIPVIRHDGRFAVCVMFFFIAAATAIFIFTGITKPVLVDAGIPEERKEEIRQKKLGSAIFVAAGVTMYIMCLTPVILFGGVGVIVMLLLAGLATALMVINGSLFTLDGVNLEELKTDPAPEPGGKAIKIVKGIIGGIFWAFVIIAYLNISFSTGKWWITWLVFPIAGMISGIVENIFNVIVGKKRIGSIRNMHSQSAVSLFPSALRPRGKYRYRLYTAFQYVFTMTIKNIRKAAPSSTQILIPPKSTGHPEASISEHGTRNISRFTKPRREKYLKMTKCSGR